MSSLERHSNILVPILFFILVVLCLALSIMENKWSLKNMAQHYYLPNTYTWPEKAPGLGGVAVQILRFSLSSPRIHFWTKAGDIMKVSKGETT